LHTISLFDSNTISYDIISAPTTPGLNHRLLYEASSSNASSERKSPPVSLDSEPWQIPGTPVKETKSNKVNQQANIKVQKVPSSASAWFCLADDFY
jgi:hypothetical protein